MYCLEFLAEHCMKYLIPSNNVKKQKQDMRSRYISIEYETYFVFMKLLKWINQLILSTNIKRYTQIRNIHCYQTESLNGHSIAMQVTITFLLFACLYQIWHYE